MELTSITTDRLEQVLIESESIVARIRATQIHVITELDQRQVPLMDGSRTLSEWAAARMDLAPETAQKLTQTAARLLDQPDLAEELIQGRVSFDRVMEESRLISSGADLELMARALARKRGLELAPEAAALIAQASNRELHQVRAILDLAGRPATGLLGAEDVSKALAILGRTPRAVGRGPVNTDDLAQLSGPQFEVWIGSLLERFGFRTEVTQASGDGGIDIVATLDRPLIGGRYLVQCKRYTPDALVGVPAVREFCGTLVADRGAVKGLLITTSGFTVQAREFAKTLPMELIDGPTLRALLEAVGGPPEEPPVSTFTPSPGT